MYQQLRTQELSPRHVPGPPSAEPVQDLVRRGVIGLGRRRPKSWCCHAGTNLLAHLATFVHSPPDEYQDQEGQVACKTCDPGYYKSSADAQQKCPAGSVCNNCKMVPCVAGTNYADQLGLTTCKPISYCKAGEKMTAAPIDSNNTVCEYCEAGTFQSRVAHLEPSCMSWRTCSAGTFEEVGGSPTSDRVCGTCTIGISYFEGVSQGKGERWGAGGC